MGMKIGFFLTDFSLGRGGERVAITLANALSKLYEVQLISLYQQNAEPFFEVEPSLKVKVLLATRKASSTILSKPFNKISELNKLIAFFEINKFDLVVGVGSYPSILLGCLIKFGVNSMPCLAWEHSNYNALNAFWKQLRKFSYPHLSSIVCLNQSDVAQFSSCFKNVLEIPNPLSFTSSEQARLNSKIILSIGAFEHEKGFDMLIEAFHKFNKQYNDWKLILIGEGSKETALKDEIGRLGLKESIVIKSPVKAIKSEYLNASVYALPSRREGFGMVLIEAMECGLPCVSFNCPTGPSSIIVDNENGILIEPENTDAMASALSSLAGDPVRLKAISEVAKKYVVKYQIDKIIPSWVSLIETVESEKIN